MKKLLLLGFIICLRLTASAQDCGNAFLGTKTLYKSSWQKYTVAPAGYVPVFINHVGRHGARHLTKDVKTTTAYTLLMQADSVNALTEKGKKLLQMVIALQKIEKGNTKFISAEGVAELAGLGNRMYLNYRNVFEGKNTFNVAVTKEVRTKQSADAFLAGLNSRLKDSAAVKFYNDDTNLRFYDLSPAYKKYEDNVDENEPESGISKEIHFDELNSIITARFFADNFLTRLDTPARDKFAADVFGFVTIIYSLKAEVYAKGFQLADVDFKSFFTCDELQKLGELDSIDENLKKGPGTDNNGLQVRVAVPLLVNFIKTTDEFIKNGGYNAQLRFAHAETIAPFAALLQISTADKTGQTLQQLNNNWRSENVIPLSANITWVFYKKKGIAGYLVKILLNEKEVHITGLKSSTAYYSWSSLRQYYINKLNSLHVKLTDDMGQYLTDIK